MSTLVESLKRLFMAGRITIGKLDEMLLYEKIAQGELDYIVSQ